jgi:hypothetical protein
MSGYTDIIREAFQSPLTKAQADEIEDVMRHTIFHSTLDWQTREELHDGAREAAKILGFQLLGPRGPRGLGPARRAPPGTPNPLMAQYVKGYQDALSAAKDIVWEIVSTRATREAIVARLISAGREANKVRQRSGEMRRRSSRRSRRSR